MKLLRFKSRVLTHNGVLLSLIAAHIIWGLSTPINKLALNNAGTLFYLASRFTIASLILAPWTIGSLKKLDRTVLRKGIFVNTFSAAAFVMLFFAIDVIPAVNASIFSSFLPLLTILFAIVFLKEPFSLKNIIGAIICFTGIFLIVVEPYLLGQQETGQVWGNALFILGIIITTLAGIFKKPLLKHMDVRVMSFLVFTITALVSWVLYFLSGNNLADDISATNLTVIIALIYSVFFVSLIGYSLYFFALQRIYAEETAVFSYLDPMVGILGSMLILGEDVSWLFLTAGFLVAVGIYISEAHFHQHKHKLHFRWHK